MSYKISDQDIQSTKQLSKRIVTNIKDELETISRVIQVYKKAFESLEELEGYFYRAGGSTNEELYSKIRMVRKEVEEALSTMIKNDNQVLKTFLNIFSDDNFVLINLSQTEELKEQFNKLFESELVDRPREVGTSYKYPTIPITVRDELKKQGFVQGRSTADWLKEYKGYTIWCKEEHSRKRIAVRIKREKELLPGGEIAYTEEQLFKIIKEFEEKIDMMRKDPSDRVTVNVDDSFDWNFMTEDLYSLEDQRRTI